MKNFVLILLSTILILNCTERSNHSKKEKYDKIVTKYTEIERINSKEVSDSFFVYIRLPKSYHKTNKRYPVLYLLDGDISFNMAISIVRYLQFGNDIPEIILVAPAYGTLMSDDFTNYRNRDYTISEIPRFIGSGFASHYLNFIKNELIPLIDNNYRSDSTRILNGYSLGGLFALKTLASEPKLFDHYIAGSPYLENDIENLSTLYNNLNLDKKKSVFITVGEFENEENYHKPIESLVKIISNTSKINIEFRKFNLGTHFTCPPEALAYGLKFIFNNSMEP